MVTPLGRALERSKIYGFAGIRASLLKNLDYYYAFDEPSGAGTYWDLTKNGNEMTVASGSPTQATGILNYAVGLSNVAPDSLVVADNSFTKHDSASISITISFWLYSVGTTATTQALVSKRANLDAVDYSISMATSGANIEYIATVNGSGSYYVTSPSQTYATYWQNRWRMVTVQNDVFNKNLRIKIDNGAWTTTSYSGGTFNPTGSPSLRVGSLTSGTNNPVNGRIDGLAKWSRLLTDNEIASLYNAGAGKHVILPDTNSYLMDSRNPNQSQIWSCARKLASTYRGALIRVRRSSDNTEKNIWADAIGNLDTAALLSFCGSGNGFVTAVYAQNSNRNEDLIQATAANQPQIVTSGVVNTNGAGKPEMVFNGTTQYFEQRLTGVTFTNSVVQMAGIIRPSAASVADTGHGTVFSYGTSTGTNYIQYLTRTAALSGETTALENTSGGHAAGSGSTSLWSAGQRLSVVFNSASSNTVSYNGSPVTLSLTAGSGVSAVYAPSGNVNLTSANGARMAVGATRSGASLTNYFAGGISELIVYTVDNTSNVSSIASNQTTYYGV
jgi:hypothetical protein